MRERRVPNISRPAISTAGFKAALKDRGVNPDEVTLFVGEGSFEFGFKGIHEHFEELREADGVFAHADITAFGVIEALREKQIEVPGHISRRKFRRK